MAEDEYDGEVDIQTERDIFKELLTLERNKTASYQRKLERLRETHEELAKTYSTLLDIENGVRLRNRELTAFLGEHLQEVNRLRQKLLDAGIED